MLVVLPFGGFYNSMFDGMMDTKLELMADSEAREHGDDVDYQHLLYEACDWRKAQTQVAQDYADAFGRFLEAQTGLKIKFSYESMSSPREYNFTTDRIFATISMRGVQRLYRASMADEHARLAKWIKGMYTRRDGFWPNYSNDIAVWLAKPLSTWDHNEVRTLLQAVLDMSVAEIEDAIFQDMYEDVWAAVENAIDWQAVERKALQARLASRSCD